MKPANYLLQVIKDIRNLAFMVSQTPKERESCLGQMESYLHLPHLLHSTGTPEEACSRLHSSGVTLSCVLGDVLSSKGQKVWVIPASSSSS
jgi:hypothetical protein